MFSESGTGISPCFCLFLSDIIRNMSKQEDGMAEQLQLMQNVEI